MRVILGISTVGQAEKPWSSSFMRFERELFRQLLGRPAAAIPGRPLPGTQLISRDRSALPQLLGTLFNRGPTPRTGGSLTALAASAARSRPAGWSYSEDLRGPADHEPILGGTTRSRLW